MPEASSQNVTLEAAKASDPAVIARLIELYLYDMAADHPFPIGDDGLYSYDLLDAFWQHPYLIRAGTELAGFALVIAACPVTGRMPCWFMAEFFVLRPHRGKSVGRHALQAVLSRHPGPWHVATQVHNLNADGFWSKALAPHAPMARPARFDGADWTVRAFSVPNGLAPAIGN